MSWMILFYIWVFVPVVIAPIFIVVSMIKELSLVPFDYWYDSLIIEGLSFVWPALLVLLIYTYRQERKERLAEVMNMVEVHYRNQWYD